MKLFGDLSSGEVPSPFNMRLLASFFVRLLKDSGLMYNTECAIDAFGQVDKRFFFNNVLFNFICVSLTSFSLYVVFVKLQFSRLAAFLAGVTFLLGFGTLFFLMMPGVDALSVLVFSWILYFYLKHSYWILLLLSLMIFQREYYFLVFMLVGLMDYFKYKTKYHLYICGTSVLLFGIYYMLRKTFFYTPHWSHQTSPSFLASTLVNLNVPLIPMLRQSVMTLNIYIIYLFVLFYKRIKAYSIDSYSLYVTLAVLVQITILSIAATFGNNNGRYFYLNTPLILYFILKELDPLLVGEKK
jgi:hypothetical protein